MLIVGAVLSLNVDIIYIHTFMGYHSGHVECRMRNVEYNYLSIYVCSRALRKKGIKEETKEGIYKIQYTNKRNHEL